MIENIRDGHHSFMLIPVAMRLACLLAPCAFHHFFHKGAHNLLHLSAHRVSAVEKAFSKCKWLPDTLMIASLVGLQLVMG